MSQNKTEVSFYQLTTTPLEKALPKLIDKIYSDAELKCFILCHDEQQMNFLDTLLWSFTPRLFLPHDVLSCKEPELQPILLGTKLDNKNNSEVLIVLNDQIITDQNFSKILDIFNGFDNDETKVARSRYKTYKEQGFKLNFWQQDESGNWVNNLS